MDKVQKSGKTFVGKIISLSMNGVAVIDIERKKIHRLYGKAYKVNKRIKAVIKDDNLKINDQVIISGTRPKSKDTHFEIIGKEK